MRRPEYLYLHEMRDAVVRIIDIVGTSSRAEIEQDHALWRERWHHVRRRGGTSRAARRRRPRGE